METTDDHYRIRVDVKSTYVSEHSSPDEGRYVFAYTVTIRNTGKVAAQLRTRHWIITDANARVQEVRGDVCALHVDPNAVMIVGGFHAPPGRAATDDLCGPAYRCHAAPE